MTHKGWCVIKLQHNQSLDKIGWKLEVGMVS